MDIYHIWCDLKQGERDTVFVESVKEFLEHLKVDGQLSTYRIARRKLGLGLQELGEFHLMLEFHDLSQLDATFGTVASRSGAVEGLHHAVNSRVTNLRFALYRDFPDDGRETGEELF